MSLVRLFMGVDVMTNYAGSAMGKHLCKTFDYQLLALLLSSSHKCEVSHNNFL